MAIIGYLQILEIRRKSGSGSASDNQSYFEGLKKVAQMSEKLLKTALPEL